MKRCLWFFLLLSFCFEAHAQLSDSLYKALPDTLRPNNKLAVTDQERIDIITTTPPAFLLHYYDEFKTLSHQLEKHINTVQDRTEKIPYANAIAIFYMTTDDRDNYFKWEKKLVGFGEGAQKYRSYICWAYTNMAIYYSGQGRQDSAIVLLHKGLAIANQNADTENLRPIMYYGYIQIYRQLALYRSALDYANKYLEAVPQKDKWNAEYTEVALVSKTSAYVALFRDGKKTAYADSARRVIKEVMLVKKAEASYWYFLCYFYLGLLDYYDQDYQSAVGYFNTSLSPVYEKTQGFRFYLPQLYKNAALISLGRSEGVDPLLNLTIPAKDYNGHRESSRVLYHYYKQHGDYQKALAHYTQYEAYSDSLDVIGQKGKVFEAEQKYSVAQKEAAITLLENKNLEEKSAKRDIAIISLIILVILLVLYVYNRRQLTTRVLEGQLLADKLQTMEKEMTLQQIKQRTDNENALTAQRKSISRTMHDEVSSSVATLRFLIKDRIDHTKSKETKLVLAELEDETTEVYQQVRDFMHRLHINDSTPAYDVADFLYNLSLTFGPDSSLQVTTQYNPETIEQYFTPKHHTEVYLFIKEAVTNSIKHAGASKLSIDVSLKNASMHIYIRDNGKGIESTVRGIGLKSMQERMKSLDGEMRFWTDAGLHILGTCPIIE